ncbi:MAG: tetratricopeptide repeat protein [Bacteroidetes bacterium]|nr:tetratricopeptide repeat protein [Bacteroidota bacterium]
MKSPYLIILALIPSYTLSQDRTFVREYTYKASEVESKASCREIALSQLRSQLLNELGVYVESQSLIQTTELKNQFTQDFTETISTLSAGITKLNVLSETWNGELYWVKASITVNLQDFQDALQKIINDRQKIKELEAVTKQLNVAIFELDSIKKELKTLQRSGARAQSQREYNNKISIVAAIDHYYVAEESFSRKEYLSSIDEYTKSILSDPNFAWAYIGRGLAYVEIQQYKKAILDYNSAIEVDPQFVGAYYCRGIVRVDLQDYQGALLDYRKAIEIDNNFVAAHISMGHALYALDEFSEALKEYNKAIELDPSLVDSYWGRATAKGSLNDLGGAIHDCDIAIKLDPLNDGIYAARAAFKLKRDDQYGSITDSNQAIEINPMNSDAYFTRGLAQLRLSNTEGGCNDLRKATELGRQEAKVLMVKYCQ